MTGEAASAWQDKHMGQTKSETAEADLELELLEPQFAKEILDVPVTEELSESFLSYALSVITSRAIPDVRDGLKPAQRRLLYAMLRMGIRPDTPHRKCARVVGETMGKFHPHGDAALYDALVRLGQDFARNFCLVDPQGNFGSLDDPPAASRYTECRLNAHAMAMLGEIDEGTVAFRPTYDGETQEPVCLPSRLPNLLVNGSIGIAVGMATNMLPHNIAEVLEAAVKILDGLPLARRNSNTQPFTEKVLGVPADKLLQMPPEELAEIAPADHAGFAPGERKLSESEFQELMKLVPGPDLPSGGVIVHEGLREIYTTGRGTVRLRSKEEIIQIKRTKRQAIIVTELPWQVGPEKVVSRIKSLMVEDKLPAVRDVRNLTDRQHGLRIQIDCRPGADVEQVLQQLYRLTPLETTFAVNNVVLVDGVPVTASLPLLLEHFVYHRLAVVVRRTHFRLQRDLARKEILEGFLKALDRIEEVVRIIRASQDVEQARQQLCAQIGLTDNQAVAVLELRLRRLTALEKDKISAELADLVAAIRGYSKILGSDTELRRVVRDELRATAKEFPRDRLSEIKRVAKLGDAAEAAEVVSKPCLVTLSANGYIGRASPADPPQKNARPHDVLVAKVLTTTDSYIWGITTAGRAVPVMAGELSEIKAVNRGSLAGKAFALAEGEEVLTIVGRQVSNPTLLLISSAGLAKRIELEGEKGLFQLSSDPAGAPPIPREMLPTPQDIFKLSEGDNLAAALLCDEADDLAIVSKQAMVLRTTIAEVPVKSVPSAPVKTMKLRPGDSVIGAGNFQGESTVLVVGDKATAKAVSTAELPSQRRGGVGLQFIPGTSNQPLLFCRVGKLEDFLAVSVESEGVPEAISLELSKRTWKTRPTSSQIITVGFPRWSSK